MARSVRPPLAALLCLPLAAALSAPAAGQEFGERPDQATPEVEPDDGDGFDPLPPAETLVGELAVVEDPAAEDAADATFPATVPGAASTEPVLRCAYRPHPTRTRAAYEFLKAHAAPGVDVSLRYVDAKTGEAIAGAGTRVRYVAVQSLTSSGQTVTRVTPVSETVGAAGGAARPELVIVAPAEAQRALGAFLQLCLADTPLPTPPADDTYGEEEEFDDFVPVPRIRGSRPLRGRSVPRGPRPPAYDDAFGDDAFGDDGSGGEGKPDSFPPGDEDAFDAAADAFGPPADPFDAAAGVALDDPAPPSDDFGVNLGADGFDDFGGDPDPADRTTRRLPPRE